MTIDCGCAIIKTVAGGGKMKTITINKVWNEIEDALDAYHYYNKEEIKQNKDCFKCAIQYKDKNYIDEICACFDDTDVYEAGIIKDIHKLMEG